jgi:prenyl protein peptidase
MMSNMIALSLLLSVAFVASLHVAVPNGLKGLSRDDDRVIWFRMKRIAIICLMGFGTIYLVERSIESTYISLGLVLSCSAAESTLASLLLTMVLFSGPLMQEYVTLGENFDIGSLQSWRNYLIAPVAEEFIFRACCIHLWFLDEVPQSRIVFLSPLLFGFAHVHHLKEHLLNSGEDVTTCVTRTLFQFTYTTVFGWYVSYLYLRTKSLYAVSAVHIFCNIMGFPNVIAIKDAKHPMLLLTVYVAGLFTFLYLFGRF